jgi:rhodanese-related sulfurtransferase
METPVLMEACKAVKGKDKEKEAMLVRVLGHRADRVASKFLKESYHVVKNLGRGFNRTAGGPAP